MKDVELGKSGLRCSQLGLGAGGPSRLGLRGKGDDVSADAVVLAALDEGVTLIDTAESYGTEEAVGRAIRGRRDEVVLCTKKAAVDASWENFVSAQEYADGIDGCLQRLGVEHVDVFYLHGIQPGEEYTHATEVLLPVLQKAKQAGKVGAIGMSEMFQMDLEHVAMKQAFEDGWPEVAMIGFGMINQTAREELLPRAAELGIGTVGMFAVRRALPNPERLREIVGELIESGELAADAIDPSDPLGFLGGVAEIIDAAYRFCLDEPGLDCLLFGTGSAEHVRANVQSVRRGPLDAALRERLVEMFRGVRSATGH